MLHERLKVLLKELGFTPTEFANKLGFKRADNINNILNNRTKGSTKLLGIIANKFDKVNLNWLVAGKGDMFFNNQPKIDSKAENSKDQTIKDLRDRIADLKDHIEALKELNSADMSYKKDYPDKGTG